MEGESWSFRTTGKYTNIIINPSAIPQHRAFMYHEFFSCISFPMFVNVHALGIIQTQNCIADVKIRVWQYMYVVHEHAAKSFWALPRKPFYCKPKLHYVEELYCSAWLDLSFSAMEWHAYACTCFITHNITYCMHVHFRWDCVTKYIWMLQVLTILLCWPHGLHGILYV